MNGHSGELAADIQWPSQQTSLIAEDVAWAFIALLLREPEWVHRRVETVGVLSRVDARRSVSVDFTVPDELRQALSVQVDSQWLVPIASVHREKLRHFDLRQDSSAICLLGNSDTSEIVFWMLALAAGLALDRRLEGGGEPAVEPTEELDVMLTSILAELAGEDLEKAREAYGKLEVLATTTSADFELTPQDDATDWDRRCSQSRAAMDYPVFSYLAAWFRENRLLVAQLDAVDKRQIVKFGYDTPLEYEDEADSVVEAETHGATQDPEPTNFDDFDPLDVPPDDEHPRDAWETINLARETATLFIERIYRKAMVRLDEMLLVTQIFDMPMRSMARAQCYHVEVAIPEELTVLSAAIYDENDFAYYDWDSDVNRVSLRAARVDPVDRPRLTMAIRPDRHGFPSAALAIGFVTSFVLVVGAWLSPLVTNRASMSVSVLLGMSALFTGLVVRSGEHRLVQASFFRARRVLFGVAMCALVAAITLAFVNSKSVQEVVWIVAAVVASLLTATLLGFWYLARPSGPN